MFETLADAEDDGEAGLHAAAPSRTCADALMAIGVPAAPVLNVEQALHHPHTVHREMVVKMGDYQGLGAPVKLSRTPASYRFAPLAEGERFLPREAANED